MRQAPPAGRRASAWSSTDGRGARRAGAAPTAPASRSPSPTRTSTCSSSTSPPASSCTPPRGHRDGHAGPGAGRPRRRRRGRGRAGIVHRLDRDTSGLLVVARYEAAHRRAAGGAAPRRELVREYLALVEGRPPARTGTIDAPLGRDRRVRTRIVDRHRPAARGASRTSRSRRRCRPRRCCASGSRPAAPTRSAPTCRPSAIPVAGDPEYGDAGPARPRAPVPARGAAGLRPPGHRRGRRRRARRCRPTSPRGAGARPAAGSA